MTLTAYVDAETTGVPDPHLLHTHPSMPHLVQVACILVDEAWAERAAFCALVRPDGYAFMPPQAEDVHGISYQQAQAHGLPLLVVVAAVAQFLRAAGRVVAHNLPFDERVLNAAMHRSGKGSHMPWPARRACTMELAESVLRIPATDAMRAAGRANQFKKPNLGECTRYFFRRAPGKHHDALADARDCMQVYRRLLEGGKRDNWFRGLFHA